MGSPHVAATPAVPAPLAAPSAATPASTSIIAASAQNAAAAATNASGQSSTILTSAMGLPQTNNNAAKQLLGS